LELLKANSTDFYLYSAGELAKTICLQVSKNSVLSNITIKNENKSSTVIVHCLKEKLFY